jgi:two-component system, LytTR family, sensor histidine kinase AlgZ
MHPLLQNRGALATYVALWAVLAGLLAALLRLAGDATWYEAVVLTLPGCMFYALMCLTPWYMCRALPLSTEWWRLTVQHLGAAILATALWIGAASGMAILADLDRQLNPAIPHLIAVGLLLYILSIALHYVLLALEASRESALLARDAELRALKSQINPHFLFNCLNSISALTTSDPSRAREMCVRLSEFLRNTLGLGERESISWKEELELARTYLEVERVRFGARLQVEMDVEESCSECRVPALVLQPLVENAIKHGIATLVDGGVVRLESRVRSGTLEVSVENEFDPEAPAPRRSGLGLRNLRDRLRTRFGGGAEVVTTAANNVFRAEMRFPCMKAES